MTCYVTRYEVKRGAKKTLNATFDVTNLPSGSLSGVVVQWYVRKTKSSVSYDITKTNSYPTQLQVTDANAGTVEIYLQPDDTVSMQPGSYYWSFRLYSDALGLDDITPENADGDLVILDSSIY